MPATVGRMWNPGMMSSIRQDWATPRALFEMLDREFHFRLDACATAETACCSSYYGPDEDALRLPWVHKTWCNPPYNRKIGNWIEKALRESRQDKDVLMLLPARTDTQGFHEYCLKGEIRFLRGRLNFDNTRHARAPFPSMIVIFRAEVTA